MSFSVRRQELAAVAVQRHTRVLPDDLLQPQQEFAAPGSASATGMRISAEASLADLPKGPMFVVPETVP